MKESNSHPGSLHDLAFSRPDFYRHRRLGMPEVVMAQSKTVTQCLAIVEAFLERTGRAILSRVPSELEEALATAYGRGGFEWHAASRMAVVRREDHSVTPTGGRVGILTAGTSDQPAAEEAAIVCREMGCEVHLAGDVGVAGLHRLVEPLRRFLEDEDVDVIIVAAGMDGALPSVVSGLVEVPVIGLPTSVGYGLGGKGEAALLSMLQTCAPGLAVVNIDNGVGAGAVAAAIANRVAAARKDKDDQEGRTAARNDE